MQAACLQRPCLSSLFRHGSCIRRASGRQVPHAPCFIELFVLILPPSAVPNPQRGGRCGGLTVHRMHHNSFCACRGSVTDKNALFHPPSDACAEACRRLDSPRVGAARPVAGERLRSRRSRSTATPARRSTGNRPLRLRTPGGRRCWLAGLRLARDQGQSWRIRGRCGRFGSGRAQHAPSARRWRAGRCA